MSIINESFTMEEYLRDHRGGISIDEYYFHVIRPRMLRDFYTEFYSNRNKMRIRE